MTTAKKTTTRAKPSGVRSESAGEAKQIRDLRARVDRLERAIVPLSQGNLAVAQDVLESHL